MTLLKYKNVLITGGAGGIGQLVAEGMAEAGATVVLWDLDKDKLKKAAKSIKDKGGRVYTHVCDVTDRKAVYKKIELNRLKYPVEENQSVINKSP